MEIRKYGDRTAVTISFPLQGRTKQSFQEECDVNFILSKWRKTGHLSHLNPENPRYEDYSSVEDYQSAQHLLMAAEDAFERLPAHVRDRMGNEPANLLRFMADPANLPEAQRLGLVNPAEPTPVENPPTPENPSPIEGGE